MLLQHDDKHHKHCPGIIIIIIIIIIKTTHRKPAMNYRHARVAKSEVSLSVRQC